jgi:hypothetical protein
LWWLLVASAPGSLRNPGRARLERLREIDEINVVIAVLIGWVCGVAGRIAERIDAAMRTATRPVSLVGGLVRDLTRSPEELLAANTLLRQQLIVTARTAKQPKFAAHERALLVVLAHFVPGTRSPKATPTVNPPVVARNAFARPAKYVMPLSGRSDGEAHRHEGERRPSRTPSAGPRA